ncbi:MAG TPA: hypothetical protein VFV37_11060 [Luteibaculaceae bacterium]|nr:hypothetical protein [Luteibaculaceae bacterium]
MIIIGKLQTEGKKQHLEPGKEYEVSEVIGELLLANGQATLPGAEEQPKKKPVKK